MVKAVAAPAEYAGRGGGARWRPSRRLLMWLALTVNFSIWAGILSIVVPLLR